MTDDGGFELLWDTGGDLTESPVWQAGTRRIVFAANSPTGGAVGAYGVDDGSRTSWPMPDKVASLGVCRSGRLVVALQRRVVLFDPETDQLTTLVDELDEPPGNTYNDGRVGPDGCFWVGTRDARRPQQVSAETKVPDPNGGLYRIRPDGSTTKLMTGVLTANGMAFAPDAKTLYFGDSANAWVDAWDVAADGEAIGNRRRFITSDSVRGFPDGAAVDSEGCYWSAGITAARINRFTPAGELASELLTPCPRPTMPCLVDGLLYLTSMAGIHPQAADPAAQRTLPHAVAGLFRIAVGVGGAPVGVFAD